MAKCSSFHPAFPIAVLSAIACFAPRVFADERDGGVSDGGAGEAGAPLPGGLEAIDVAAGFASASLSAAAEWAEEPARRLTIADVASPSAGGLAFRPVRDGVPHFGYTKSAIWARAAIRNSGATGETVALEVEYALIDRIELFLSRDGGRSWERRLGGDALPFAEREADDRNVMFSVRVLAGETLRVYMRFESTSSLQLPLTLSSTTAYAAAKGGEQLWYGMLYGLLVAMVLYHLFLYFPTRNASYLYYCAYIAFGLIVLSGLIGHGYQFLWPWSPWFEGVAIPFSIAVWISLSCLFTRHFLRTWEASRIIDRFLLTLIAVPVATAALSLVGDVRVFTRVNIALCLVAAVGTTVIGFARWRGGFRAARFFFLAWFLFGVGVVLYAVKSLGLLPSNAVTQQGIYVGTAIEAILISMALGDYINMLRAEQERSQAIADRRERERAAKMTEIRDLAGFLSEVARSMSDVMARLGRSSRDLAAALAESNTTIAEIEQSATSVAGTAERIAGESQRRFSDFESGRGAMVSTAEAMGRARTESERIADMSDALFKRIEEIDDVVGLVRSVSNQSKVLAVNASIEAANAGNLGKGFGVIAVEVRNLAQQSNEATAHVAELLASIRSSLGRIVEAARYGAEQTHAGSTAIDSARGVVGALGDGLSESAAQANQIAVSIAEQTGGIGNILAAMARIGRTAEENLEATSGMARATGDVERTVEQLRGLVKSWSGEG
jgi:methyl-accepting chemotaxis protein